MSITAMVQRASRGVDRYGWPAVLREAGTRPLRPAFGPAAGSILRRRAAAATDVDGLLALAYDFEAFGITIRPGQVRSEILRLLGEVRGCRRLLEIGTANGGTLFLFAQLAAPDAHLISVDLPHGEFGGGYPAWKLPLYKRFARPGQRLDLVRGDSHAAATAARVRNLLAGECLDFLFIDGDHTYAGVRQDFETFKPLVRPGGLIAFHDIAAPRPGAPRAGGPTLLGGDVPQYWAALRGDHEHEEFRDAPHGNFGIGLLRV
jgi:predicted O-methyltransferase YrrM